MAPSSRTIRSRRSGFRRGCISPWRSVAEGGARATSGAGHGRRRWSDCLIRRSPFRRRGRIAGVRHDEPRADGKPSSSDRPPATARHRLGTARHCPAPPGTGSALPGIARRRPVPARAFGIRFSDCAQSSGWGRRFPGIAAFEGPWTSWDRGHRCPRGPRQAFGRPRAGSPRSREGRAPGRAVLSGGPRSQGGGTAGVRPFAGWRAVLPGGRRCPEGRAPNLSFVRSQVRSCSSLRPKKINI